MENEAEMPAVMRKKWIQHEKGITNANLYTDSLFVKHQTVVTEEILRKPDDWSKQSNL